MKQRFHQFLFAFMLSAPAFAGSGLYMGGEIGYSYADNPGDVNRFARQAKGDAENLNTSVHIDDNLNSTSKGFFVGYWLEDYLAVEVSYGKVVDGAILYDFDEMGHLGFSADIDRYSLTLLPVYKLSDRLDLYGRIGYAESSADIETGGAINQVGVQTTTGESINIDYDNYSIGNETSAGVLAGVGVRFHNDHYFMRIEGQYDNSLYGLRGIVMGFGYQF